MTRQDSASDRRQFLAGTASALVLAQAASAADPDKPLPVPRRDPRLLESPVFPQFRIPLPTDGLPREPRPKRLAAITTAFWKNSHADDIITRFIEGYAICGRSHLPQCRVVSMYIDQFPKTDIGKGIAAHYNIPLVTAPAEALTLGGRGLSVDGVLIVAERGNEKGPVLNSRKKWFGEILKVFADLGSSVPVFVDEQLAHNWEDASWMYDESKKRKCTLMAGSSLPLAWRIPPVELRFGTRIDSMLAVGAGDLENNGFDVLELLQAFAERRPGGETGVKAVSCYQGPTAWQAAKEQLWNPALLGAVTRFFPPAQGNIQEVDKDATVCLIEYTDGFRAACYLSPAFIREYGIAFTLPGLEHPVATWCYLPRPQRDEFSFLCGNIEKMFLTDMPTYPVERTLLTTGMLAYLKGSRFEGNKRVATPELSKISYRPPAQ